MSDPTSTPTAPPAPCATCGSTPCLALVRANIPPVGWIDFLDRTIARLTSSHWTVRQSGHLLAFVLLIGLAGTFVSLAATDKLPALIEHATQTPWGWAYLVGGSALAGGGYTIRHVRTRRHH